MQIRVGGFDAGVEDGHGDPRPGGALPQVLGLQPAQTPLQVAAGVVGGQGHGVTAARGVDGQNGVAGGFCLKGGRVGGGGHFQRAVIGAYHRGHGLGRWQFGGYLRPEGRNFGSHLHTGVSGQTVLGEGRAQRREQQRSGDEARGDLTV